MTVSDPDVRAPRRTLRTRLVFIVAALVLGAIVLLSVVSVIILRQSLLTQAETVLYLSQESLVTQLDDAESGTDLVETLGSTSGFVPASDGFYIVADGTRRLASLYLTRDFDLRELNEEEAGAVLNSVEPDGGTYTVEIDRVGSFLVTATTLSVHGVDTAPIVAYSAIGLTDTNTTVGTFLAWEAGVGAVAAGLVILFGYRTIRTALRPLEQVVDVVDKVAQTPLSSGEVARQDRVPVMEGSDVDEATRVARAVNRLLSHMESSLNARHQTEESMRRFIAEASHELRNPLASIRGYVDLYQHLPGLEDEVREALERIGAESTRMTALVKDLLLLARLDAGPTLRREPVDVCQVVMECVADTQIAHPTHRWNLRLPTEPIIITGDDDALRQILLNMLGNAAHHTPPGTTVTTTATMHDESAVVTVNDDGPGIPDHALDTVFDRFTQVPTSGGNTRDASNVGLGLAIIHALTTEMGGTVTVTSIPGSTAFTVTLPISSS